MVRRAEVDLSPNSYAIAGTGTWPYCRVSGPAYVHAVANFARQVDQKRDGRSIRDLGRLTAVDANVISRILRGDAWANGLQLFKLATVLGIDAFGPTNMQTYQTRQLIEDLAAHLGRADLLEIAVDPPGAAGTAQIPYVPDLYVPESGMPIETRHWAGLTSEEWERQATATVRHFERLNQAFGSSCQQFVLVFDAVPTATQTKWLAEHGIQVICRSDSGFTDSLGGWLIERIMRSEPIPRTN
jgi:hypothetical protein